MLVKITFSCKYLTQVTFAKNKNLTLTRFLKIHDMTASESFLVVLKDSVIWYPLSFQSLKSQLGIPKSSQILHPYDTSSTLMNPH